VRGCTRVDIEGGGHIGGSSGQWESAALRMEPRWSTANEQCSLLIAHAGSEAVLRCARPVRDPSYTMSARASIAERARTRRAPSWSGEPSCREGSFFPFSFARWYALQQRSRVECPRAGNRCSGEPGASDVTACVGRPGVDFEDRYVQCSHLFSASQAPACRLHLSKLCSADASGSAACAYVWSTRVASARKPFSRLHRVRSSFSLARLLSQDPPIHSSKRYHSLECQSVTPSTNSHSLTRSRLRCATAAPTGSLLSPRSR